jgi:hypothetical protein
MIRVLTKNGLVPTLLCLALSAPASAQAPAPPPAVPTGDALKKLVRLSSGTATVRAPKIVTDTAAAPDLAEWANYAATLMTEWYPVVWGLLGTEGQTPATEIKVTFQLKQDAPAYATGGGIFVSVPWVRSHPDDFGMMIHEMTHLIQSYPGRKPTDTGDAPGWLVEGVADYVRWWRYEPEAPRPRLTAKNKYTDSYRVTAFFLAYLTQKYDRALVQKLDRALRTRSYTPAFFEQATGKNLDDLWAEFLRAQGG